MVTNIRSILKLQNKKRKKNEPLGYSGDIAPPHSGHIAPPWGFGINELGRLDDFGKRFLMLFR
jgi:hypothetical protein